MAELTYADYDGLPISDALSLGVHESQSLLWERMVALTPHFCKYLLPKIQDTFPEFGKGKTPEVRASLRRVPPRSRITCQSCWRHFVAACKYRVQPIRQASGRIYGDWHAACQVFVLVTCSHACA